MEQNDGEGRSSVRREKIDLMGLSLRTIVVVVGLSFGLGVAAASHKMILAQLGQASTAFSSLELPKFGGQGSSTPSEQTSDSRTLASHSGGANSLFPVDHRLPQRGDVRIVVMSDLNGPFRSTTYRQEVKNSILALPTWEPDLVLSVGDMIGGQLLSLTPEEIQAMWQGFDQHIFQPIQHAGIPLAVAIGQRDGSALLQSETQSKRQSPTGDLVAHIPPGAYIFEQERAEAQNYWSSVDLDLGIDRLPSPNFPFRYSFVHNDIFFLVWDASTAELDETELIWAEQQLSSTVAQQARMRISMGHFPLYAIAQGRDRPNEFLAQGDAIRDLLETYNVYMHIAGHHHAYYPGRVGDLELLYSGTLGAGPRSLLGTDEQPIRTLTVMDIFFDASKAPDVWVEENDTDSEATVRSPERDRRETLDGIATVYTTYNMATMDVIDPQTLPRAVAGPTGLVLRQDMERRDLTYQDNLRYVRSW